MWGHSRMRLGSRVSEQVFQWVHQRSLLYTACWEDPRVDRSALGLTASDRVLVITSAGCNALDYALDSPHRIHAVDVNFRQNALLELKLAGIRNLPFERFFDLFGRGYLPDVRDVYRLQLRADLSKSACDYWDRHIRMFANRRRSFYFRGGSGTFAWLLSRYLRRDRELYEALERLFNASSVREQREIYRKENLRQRFWTPWVRWGLAHPALLAISGIPRAQFQHAYNSDIPIAEQLQRCAEYCITQQPLADNYFWRLYLTGSFTRECCPEYLKPANFERLQGGLADCISVHDHSVTSFLESHRASITRFAMLDHFDWYHGRKHAELEAEWQAIVDKAAPGARLIWRSMGADTHFVDQARVCYQGRPRKVGELLRYQPALSAELFATDRTRTYQSFQIADLVG